MRLSSCLIAVSLPAMLAIGCLTVSPDECWDNTSGGLGGSGTIPIGAVGATSSGGDSDSPNSGTPNPCVTPSDEADPQQSDAPVESSLKIFCSKPDHGAICSERCLTKGIGCVPLALQPYKPDGGIGKLFSCNDLVIGFMCGYHYPNGDDCYFPYGLPFPKTCAYSGND